MAELNPNTPPTPTPPAPADETQIYQLEFDKAELEKIATDKGYPNLEEAIKDKGFKQHVTNSYTNIGRMSGYNEALGEMHKFATEVMGIEIEKGKKVTKAQLEASFDAAISKKLADAKKEGANPDQIKELEKRYEAIADEKIKKLQDEKDATIKQLEADRDSLKNEFEAMKGAQLTSRLKSLVDSNIPVSNDAEKLPYDLSMLEKESIADFLKSTIDISDDGKSFKAKGKDIPAFIGNYKLEADGSNLREFIREFCKTKGIDRVKRVVVEQTRDVREPLETKKYKSEAERRRAEAEATKAHFSNK